MRKKRDIFPLHVQRSRLSFIIILWNIVHKIWNNEKWNEISSCFQWSKIEAKKQYCNLTGDDGNIIYIPC